MRHVVNLGDVIVADRCFTEINLHFVAVLKEFVSWAKVVECCEVDVVGNFEYFFVFSHHLAQMFTSFLRVKVRLGFQCHFFRLVFIFDRLLLFNLHNALSLLIIRPPGRNSNQISIKVLGIH